jgi:glutamine synthetase
VNDIRPLVQKIGKLPQEWQRADLVKVCREEGIRIVNFRYPSFDGKLRELRLPVNNDLYLQKILATGERVDGSSLYPGLFGTGKSDLYVLPVYRWAFLNPWAADELDIVCRLADQEGAPSADTPDNLVVSLAERIRHESGLTLKALAELEFYLILDRTDDRFTGKAQRNYQQSAPYLHGHAVADEILRTASAVCGGVKYCHSEVGYIDRLESDDPELHGRRVEQYELEFDLLPIEVLNCWLTVVRWLVRVIADRHGASVTFVPKLDQGMAGSGLHLHLALERDSENVIRDAAGKLTDESLRLMGGLLEHAAPLTAFGNTVAASYLRLVPNQEAPTRICWGERNRSSLIRVPLDFRTASRLDRVMNPDEAGSYPENLSRPTIEYRSPDGSAYSQLLLAAVALCVEDGLRSPDSLDKARALEVEGNIFADDELRDRLERLPASAVEAAASLREHREFFEQGGFPSRLIDLVLTKLEGEADHGLTERLKALPAAERLQTARRLMHKDLHKN